VVSPEEKKNLFDIAPSPPLSIVKVTTISQNRVQKEGRKGGVFGLPFRKFTIFLRLAVDKGGR